MERDFDTRPYTDDEARVAKFLIDKGIGGGDDPIGFLMATYAYVMAERARRPEKIEIIRMDSESVSGITEEINRFQELGWETHGGIIIRESFNTGRFTYFQFFKKGIPV